jgi:methyl-accepting chemotaxis protein
VSDEMTIPVEILSLVEQLTDELDGIEQKANEGLAKARQLLERFPNNARLIGLSANVGNGLFFVDSFRNRIDSITQRISGINVSIEAIQQAGEELSEIWGRILECKITVSRSVRILEDLQ